MNLSKLNDVTKGRVKTTGVSDFSELELHKVYPNPNQPRKNFADIDELAASISTNGLIQPIAVVKDNNGMYMIISGERRHRACTSLKLRTIKAHIIEADEKKILELALVENIQRDDLTDFEKVKFINQLWASENYATKKDLAQAIGKSQSYLSKVFKAINLCDEIIEDIEVNKKDIGLEILQELSRIKDVEMQLEVYKKNPTREQIRNAVWIANENRKSRNQYKKEDEPKISPAKKKELSFDSADFENIEEDLKKGIIFHPQNHSFKINNLKRYKMYRITIEEV